MKLAWKLANVFLDCRQHWLTYLKAYPTIVLAQDEYDYDSTTME